MRQLPCPADIHGPPVDLYDVDMTEQPPNNEDPEDFKEQSEGLNSISLEFRSYGSAWWDLRRRMWKLLDYEDDSGGFDKFYHMWQTGLEIQTVGWPVLPVSVYLDPANHSTQGKDRDDFA